MSSAPEASRLAHTAHIALGANLALLDNAGHSALWWAERRVELDAAPPAAGAAPVTAAQRKEHRALVALLKAAIEL